MEPWGIWTSASVGGNGLWFQTVEYAPDHWAERHAHDMAFVDLLLSGKQEAVWDGEAVRRTPGTAVLMPVGEAHATASPAPTLTFQVAIGPSWGGFAESMRSLRGPCAHVDIGPIAWHLTQMWAEFRSRDDLTPAVLEGRLILFLDALVGQATPKGEVSVPWLRKAHDYVRAHAQSGFAVADVATEIGVDPAHLMRSYARYYGATMGDDARRHRVAHACRLLTQTEPSLGEVALAAGFVDQSHLNRVFKRLTGLTPREYRQTCRSSETSFPSKNRPSPARHS